MLWVIEEILSNLVLFLISPLYYNLVIFPFEKVKILIGSVTYPSIGFLLVFSLGSMRWLNWIFIKVTKMDQNMIYQSLLKICTKIDDKYKSLTPNTSDIKLSKSHLFEAGKSFLFLIFFLGNLHDAVYAI